MPNLADLPAMKIAGYFGQGMNEIDVMPPFFRAYVSRHTNIAALNITDIYWMSDTQSVESKLVAD